MLSTAESANATRLVAPREYGKTSLLRRALFEAESQGWVTVYVHRAAQGRPRTGFAGVRRRFPRLRIGGAPAPVSAEVDLRPDAEEPVLKRLEMPRRILERTGRRTLVCFDEFQAVMTVREDADEVIRAGIQHHTDEASYVVAASEVGGL